MDIISYTIAKQAKALAQDVFNKLGQVGTKQVDETNIGQDKVLAYNVSTGKLEYISVYVENSIVASNINGRIMINGTEVIIYDDTQIIDTLNTKAESVHGHEIVDVTGLQDELDKIGQVGTKVVDETSIGDGKILAYNLTSDTVEYITMFTGVSSVAQSGINGYITVDGTDIIVYDDSGKADVIHVHEIVDITGLQDELNKIGQVGTKIVDETSIADGKVLSYNIASGNLEYITVSVESDVDDTLTTSTTKTWSIDKIQALLDQKQSKFYFQPTEPPTPVFDDVWVDNSTTPYVTKIFDGTVWSDLASGRGKSEDIEYLNSAYPTIANVKQALDKLLYVTPIINTFTVSPITAEKGSTVSTLSFVWTLNKDIISQSIDQGVGSIPAADRNKTLSGLTLTSDTTYTLSINDGTTSITKAVTVAFRQKRYWGVSPKTNLVSSDVLALSGNEFATNRNQSKTLSPANQYLYFAWPATFGTPSFKVNGLANNAWVKDTISFTNASGFVEIYDVYRSQYLQNGTGIIVDIT